MGVADRMRDPAEEAAAAGELAHPGAVSRRREPLADWMRDPAEEAEGFGGVLAHPAAGSPASRTTHRSGWRLLAVGRSVRSAVSLCSYEVPPELTVVTSSVQQFDHLGADPAASEALSLCVRHRRHRRARQQGQSAAGVQ